MDMQTNESVIYNIATVQGEHCSVLSNDDQQTHSEACPDIVSDYPFIIDEGYITTSHADVMDSNEARSDVDDDDELADNRLIIDEDYENESDRTLIQDSLDTEHSPTLIDAQAYASRTLKKSRIVTSDISRKNKNTSSNSYLIDHDYFTSTVRNTLKAKSINSFTNIYKNENVVVMKELLSDELNWQKSVQEKLFQDRNLDIELAECDESTATFFDVNKLKRDESNDNIEHSFTKTENDKINSYNQNLNNEQNSPFEKPMQGQKRRIKSQHKLSSLSFVTTNSSDNVDYNGITLSDRLTKKTSLSEGLPTKKTSPIICKDTLVAEKQQAFPKLDADNAHSNKNATLQHSNLAKVHTVSKGLQKQVLKPKTGNTVFLLVPLVSPLRPEQINKFVKADQSLKIGLHETRLDRKTHAKQSLLDRRKITVTKRSYLETASQVLKATNITEETVPDIGNSVVKRSSCPKSPTRNSNEMFCLTKKTDNLLKGKVANSTRLEERALMPTKSVEISDNVKNCLSNETTCLYLEERHAELTGGRRVFRGSNTQSDCCTESVASKADSENPFDKYITGLQDAPDVIPDNCQPSNSKTNVGDITNTDTDTDIKPDTDKLITGADPVEGTVVNDCEAASVELKILKCKECCSEFEDVISFDLHLIWCDVDAKKSKICGVCRVAFPDLKSLNTHDCSRVANSVDYTCGVCKKIFKKRDVVFVHMKIHTTNKEFICEICQKSFLHKHHLITHMKTHLSDRPYKCQVCSAAFKRQAHLQKHQSSHKTDGERKYKCQYCDWSFHDKYKLTRHEETHSPTAKRFVCSICKGAFRDKCILAKHVKNVHSDGRDTNKSCNKPKQQLECEICEAKFFWKRHLKKHMSVHGEVLTDSDEDADDDFKDELEETDTHKSGNTAVKDKAFRTRNSARTNISKGNGKHNCKECTKTFITEKLLEVHTQTEHTLDLIDDSEVECASSEDNEMDID